MTIDDFNMIIADNYADYIQNYYPSFITTDIKKSEFRMYSDYRWAINELMDYVYDYIYENEEDGTADFPVFKFIEAVVQFEYDMDLYSEVNDRKRSIFKNAQTLAEDVEEVLNAIV